jgi:putative addiction module killer protein
MELKIDYGPGWRIYYKQVGKEIVILLTGGTKNGQQQDIEAAKKLAREIGR